MRFALGLLAASLLLMGCGDDPFLVRWTENPTEEVLFALDREELNKVSAFDMRFRTSMVIERSVTEGKWDFAVERQGDQMMILPPGALGVESTAALVPFAGTEYDEVMSAPADTLLYISEQPIPIDLTTIYVVRTHQHSASYGGTCVYYGKIQPLEVDLEVGTFRFLHDASPDCNNLSLLPPR
jgi:hypothetical protein